MVSREWEEVEVEKLSSAWEEVRGECGVKREVGGWAKVCKDNYVGRGLWREE